MFKDIAVVQQCIYYFYSSQGLQNNNKNNFKIYKESKK